MNILTQIPSVDRTQRAEATGDNILKPRVSNCRVVGSKLSGVLVDSHPHEGTMGG